MGSCLLLELSCYLDELQVLIIREKLADLYEAEQQWSKAAQILSGIDLDSAMRSESKLFLFLYFINRIQFCMSTTLYCNSFCCVIFIRVIDDAFRLSKCVKIASLYLEVHVSKTG